MKNYILVVLGLILFTSCDPDVPGEGIDLPTMNFGFKVSPDTAYVKKGDTLTISAAIRNPLENDVKIKDGLAVVSAHISFRNETPIEDFSSDPAYEDIYIYIYPNIGSYQTSSTGQITRFIAIPTEDSIKMELQIVPIVVGTYAIQVQSNFFEGSQGKTRTNPKFEMPNHHFDELWKISGDDYKPGDMGYDSRYLFAVYE